MHSRTYLPLVTALFFTLSPLGNAQTTVTTKEGNAVWILDADGDGWDDLWRLFYPKIAHADKTIDTDGDGETDFEEMLSWRDPLVRDDIPQERTQAEIDQERKHAADTRAAAQKAWQEKLAAAAPHLRPLIPPDQLESPAKVQRGEDSSAALRREAEAARQMQPAKERALEDIARKYGIPKELHDENGKKLKLSGELENTPVFLHSHDTASAAGLSADELWPATAWPYSDLNTGRNLSGAGQTLALWEVDGGVRTTHVELGTARFKQRDLAALDTSGHASQVAGTMAASGSGIVLGGFFASRGAAYQANVFAYNLQDFAVERAAAAAGGGIDPAVRISNHSWDALSGWRREDIDPSAADNLQWVWYGPTAGTFLEDVKFGLYTGDRPDGTSSTQIDNFLHANAPQHTKIYSCGNDRTEGPGASPGTYYYRIGNAWVPENAASVPRDWDDGDAGFFDTLAPPGTAKNVLTVGACEDVFHTIGMQTFIGFGPNANAVPAFFSGAGPTDDGRIKPDLVAVGTTNFPIRQALGLTAGTTAYALAPTSGNDSQYTTVAIGTSFAAPLVSGGLGLVLQRRAQLYPALPAAAAWRGSTLKAIAIDTCDDVGNAGPDYRMGYGIFNARSAGLLVDADLNNGRGSLIKELSLAPSTSTSWVIVSGGIVPLSATAAWTDPVGPAPPTTASDPQNAVLVNNLDLQLEYLGSDTLTFPPASTVQATFLPWILNPDLTNEGNVARSAAATRGIDNRTMWSASPSRYLPLDAIA